KWTDRCFERLVGDYALAYWDAASRQMVLARDPLGQQPLHYHRGNGFFAFASMPKGLHALQEVPYAPDEERIAEKLVMMAETGTGTFFKGVERVLPGHVLKVDANSLALRQHWQPKRGVVRYRNSDDYAEA